MKKEKQVTPAKKSMFSDVQEELFATTIEALIPKIKPFIKPAIEKFIEFLGDNEKTIIIRRLKDSSPMVFVLDNTSGNYEIKNDSNEKINAFSGSQNPSPIKDVYNVELFVERLLTGELMKELKK